MTHQTEPHSVYLASVALEPNRWKSARDKVPSFEVSAWSERVADAGFSGWELWEHHYFLASPEEREALAGSGCPVRIFNTYALPGIDPAEKWERVVEAVKALGPQVKGIKFNLGKSNVSPEVQINAAMDWAARLPESIRMLCECHPGTVLETPEAAAEAFELWPAGRFGAILHPMGTSHGHCESWFSALNGKIEHLHWQARDDNNRVCALRDRPDILPVANDSLRKHSFKGSQSIEFVHGTGRPGESVPKLFEEAKRDLGSLRDLYRGW